MISIWALIGITFLISIIIAIIFGFYAGDANEGVYCFFSSMMIINVLLTFVFMITVGTTEEKETFFKDKQVVVSLSDSISMTTHEKGTFFLGTGTIEKKEEQISVYNALVGKIGKDSNEGVKMKSFVMEDTELFFDENKQPYVQKRMQKTTTHFKENWFNGGLIKPIKTSATVHFVTDELHLPENTLQIEYNVDLN